MERGQEARKRYENPKKRIDGILFDTEDPTTRLIGEKATEADSVDAEDHETFYEQLWRTNDAHYLIYDGVSDPRPLDVKTAHEYMKTDWAYRKFLTDGEKRDVELDDEKRHEGRF